MNNFDLVGALRTYATSKGWVFIYGDNFFQNYEASKSSYTPGQLILGADPFIATPKMITGKIESITYNGLIMLGRKFESDSATPTPSVTTISNLDELMIQKYDRRLYELMGTLSSNLLTFACTHELDIENSQFEMRINQLDENIDFIVCSVQLKQG